MKRRIQHCRSDADPAGAGLPAAPALVSRDAFCVLSGVSERELAMWEQEALVAPARVVMLDGRREAALRIRDAAPRETHPHARRGSRSEPPGHRHNPQPARPDASLSTDHSGSFRSGNLTPQERRMHQNKLPCCQAERQRRISAKRWIFFSHFIDTPMIAASAVPSYSLRSASNRPPVPEMRDEAR